MHRLLTKANATKSFRMSQALRPIITPQPLRQFTVQQQEAATSEVMAARKEAHQVREVIARGKNR